MEARRRGPQALAALAAMVAYEVTDRPEGLEAVIGFSASTGRRKRPMPMEMLRFVTGGGTVTITREHQQRIAAKLRRRGRYSEQRIRRAIPRLGARLVFPERDWATEVTEAERENSARNIAALYEAKLAGQRWARVWWTGTAGQVLIQETTRTVVR